MDPTEADIEWMAARAKELTDRRLESLGHGARLCDEEVDRIVEQAAMEGQARAEEMVLQKRRDEDALARATGKPTLRVTLGDLLTRKQP